MDEVTFTLASNFDMKTAKKLKGDSRFSYAYTDFMCHVAWVKSTTFGILLGHGPCIPLLSPFLRRDWPRTLLTLLVIALSIEYPSGSYHIFLTRYRTKL